MSINIRNSLLYEIMTSFSRIFFELNIDIHFGSVLSRLWNLRVAQAKTSFFFSIYKWSLSMTITLLRQPCRSVIKKYQ